MKSVFPELIAVDIEAVTWEEAIRKVGKLLLDNGFVKDTYIDAAVKREITFPTGLQLKDIAVAMPHTDSAHVIKPAVCVAKLKKPVEFSHMAQPEIKVQAEILFMMAIKDPDKQVETLQSVLQVFQNPEVVAKFKAAKTKEELFDAAEKYIG